MTNEKLFTRAKYQDRLDTDFVSTKATFASFVHLPHSVILHYQITASLPRVFAVNVTIQLRVKSRLIAVLNVRRSNSTNEILCMYGYQMTYI